MHIGLLAEDGHDEENCLLADELQNSGFTFQFMPWQAAKELDHFDAVIFRTPLTYRSELRAFSVWLQQLRQSDVTVLNSPDVISWNMDKHYLAALKKNGVSVIPTYFLEEVGETALQKCVDHLKCSDIVIKPSVSASGYKTYKTSMQDIVEDQHNVRDIIEECGCCLVQPYLPEVERDGEWSLIFFNGVFSHAVLKKPQDGDFRVQKEYGGEISIMPPNIHIIEQATDIMRALPYSETLLYARIDGLVVDEMFLLMEAELFEPELFFRTTPIALQNFVTALKQRLG